MFDITNTTSILTLCYDAPDLDPTITGIMEWCYYYIIASSLLTTGLLASMDTIYVTVVAWLVQIGLTWVLVVIQYLSGWMRPADISINCSRGVVFWDALNKYGGNDPIFVPNMTMLIIIIYVNYNIHKRPLAYLVIVLAGVIGIGYTVIEFKLGRVYYSQYFENLALVAVFATSLCLIYHYAYMIRKNVKRNLSVSLMNQAFSLAVDSSEQHRIDELKVQAKQFLLIYSNSHKRQVDDYIYPSIQFRVYEKVDMLKALKPEYQSITYTPDNKTLTLRTKIPLPTTKTTKSSSSSSSKAILLTDSNSKDKVPISSSSSGNKDTEQRTITRNISSGHGQMFSFASAYSPNSNRNSAFSTSSSSSNSVSLFDDVQKTINQTFREKFNKKSGNDGTNGIVLPDVRIV